MKWHDDIGKLAERIADLTHNVTMLENLVRESMESGRRCVAHFARLAAIARYATIAPLQEIDREMIIESVLQLSEQYEREALVRREALCSAYAMRQFRNDDAFMSSFRH
ncbi:hypothetical protein WS97_00460 [Burkholderia territorii]|uniref:hypothetical protein n=1 Tax=Burkholderia territorii TaxID=1503055 RepID=UPI000753F841|nr:hypothetical protein [Burkholderia territorii]KVL25428.1 hypothetical protein WS97_00460 [Burkholderia territorii]